MCERDEQGNHCTSPELASGSPLPQDRPGRWHAETMDALRLEPAFIYLYEDAKEALAQGYRRADQVVYNFAMDYDMSPGGVAANHGGGVSEERGRGAVSFGKLPR